MTGERQGWAWLVEPIAVPVMCTGALHIVRWQRGKIVLDDHDVRAEASFIALGGGTVPCMRVLQAWRHATLASFEIPEATRALMQRHGRTPDWVVDLDRDLVPSRVLSLVVGYERAWRRRTPFVSGRDLVERTLRDTAAPGLNEWMMQAGVVGHVPVELSCNLLPPSHGVPSVDAWLQRGSLVVAAWLRPDWIRRVHLVGRAVVDGYFIVDIDGPRTTVAEWIDDRTVVTTTVDGLLLH